MFLKKITKGKQNQYTYYRLCESYRIGGKTRHHILLNLGPLDELDEVQRKLLADRIEDLYRGNSGSLFADCPPVVEQLALQFVGELRDKYKNEINQISAIAAPQRKEADYQQVDLSSVVHDQVREAGTEWLCIQAAEQLGIASFLRSRGWDEQQVNTAITDIVSRAVYPASEHKTSAWIESSSAVSYLVFGEHQSISNQRLYRMSDLLYAQKPELEKYLSVTTSSLFNLRDKIILYDLTNSYFEGRKVNSKIAQFGRSKEKRSDAKLVSLALVVDGQGFTKYSRIYTGNISEPQTLIDTIKSMAAQNPSGPSVKPIVVMDAGIATADNLNMLKEQGYDYLCVTRSKLKDYKVVNPDRGMVEIEDNRKHKISLQRVTVEGDKDNYMLIRSQYKAIKEASMGAHFSSRYEQELDRLDASIRKKGGVKKVDKVYERIGRIKERYPSANKHYTIQLDSEGNKAVSLSYQRRISLKEASERQGVYFIRTSLPLADEKVIWNIYNTLTEVESAFRILKTDLSLRPIFHQKDSRTEAHIFLGVLAYDLVSTIRHQLKAKGIHHDWANIIRIMNTQKLVTTSMKNKEGEVIMLKKFSRPSREVAEIYQAMNYSAQPFTIKKFVFPQ